MNLLILVSNIGSSATGSVCEDILSGLLENKVNLRIITSGSSTNSINADRVRVIPIKRLADKQYVTYLFYLILNSSFNEIKWKREVYRCVSGIISSWRPNFIMVIASAQDIHLLHAGHHISKQYNLPLYIHATDPIPSINEWFKYNILRRAIFKTTKKVFRAASVISLTNPAMLDYQLKLDGIEKSDNTFVAMNPVRGPFINRVDATEGKQIFLYLGSIMHQRRPDLLIESFIDYGRTNKKAILRFAGDNSWFLKNYSLPEEQPSGIEFLGWTDDPDGLIKNASVLVDIDAPFERDVFISSKLNRYLNSDVPVLALTPENSPSAALLNEFPQSTVVVHYNKEDIIRSFDRVLSLRLIENAGIEAERKAFIMKLDYRYIAANILRKLEAFGKDHKA